jgi:DNA-binding transcriptional LysR family regulator
MGVSFLSAHTIGMELQAGQLTVLDVEGFPAWQNWYVVHRRSKRLPPVALAFKHFLLADGARLIDGMMAYKSPLPPPDDHLTT